MKNNSHRYFTKKFYNFLNRDDVSNNTGFLRIYVLLLLAFTPFLVKIQVYNLLQGFAVLRIITSRGFIHKNKKPILIKSVFIKSKNIQPYLDRTLNSRTFLKEITRFYLH